MDSNIYKNAQEILEDDTRLKEFSELNRITLEVAKKLLESLMEKPEIEEKFKEYIFSNDRSEDFKGYTAGEEKGYQRGHETGFAKGAATIGILTVLTLGGLFYLTQENS